jgi:uncharacterized protein with PIN domain
MIRFLLLSLSILAAAPFAAPARAQTTPVVEAAPSAGMAETDPELYAMLSAMGIYEILAIIGQENIRSAESLEDSMFPGQGGAPWIALVTRLHAADRMAQMFENAFSEIALTPAQVAEVTAFMTSETGRQLIEGEVATRQLFLDEDEVDVANDRFMAALEAGEDRLEILYDLNEVNGFVERNVTGALNLQFAFYRGLADGDALAAQMSEATMVEQVWSQEPEVRQMTVEWLFSYQLAAYSSVSDEALRAYVDFGRSEAGRAVNAALFAAFDEVLGVLSYEIGTGAASFIVGEDT